MRAQTRAPRWYLPLPLPALPSLRPRGGASQRHAAVGAWGAPTPRFHVALDQGAGSVSLWLINVQFEVYYEPPGFNYCTIIQSIPCHFIFMAFVMPLYVQSPHSVLEEFPCRLGFTPFFSLVPIVVYSGPLFAPSTPSSSPI